MDGISGIAGLTTVLIQLTLPGNKWDRYSGAKRPYWEIIYDRLQKSVCTGKGLPPRLWDAACLSEDEIRKAKLGEAGTVGKMVCVQHFMVH